MPWTTGTVTGHLELMTVLRDFLTTNAELVAAGQEWEVMKEETIASHVMTSPSISTPSGGWGATFRDLYLRGSGLAGLDNIHVNLRTYEAPSYNIYNWMVQGATGFEDGVPWNRQPGNSYYSSDFHYLPMTNSTIKYWIVADGRRFILVVKIGTRYLASYCGLLLPYSLPSEYPYPMLISGTTSNRIYGVDHSTQSNFWRNESGNPTMLRLRSGDWERVGYFWNTNISVSVWPWSWMAGITTYYRLLGHPDGGFPLLPAIVGGGSGGGGVFGEMPGVYFIPVRSEGISALSEDIVTVDGVDHLVVQNVSKIDEFDFAAIRLE